VLARPPALAGEVVLLRGDFTLLAIAWLLALAEARAIVAPVAVNVPEEIAARVRVALARFIIHATGPEPVRLESLPAAGEETSTAHDLLARLRTSGDAGLILFSSGSTGEPKAMLHDLDHLFAKYADLKARRVSMLAFLLFDHIGGLNTLLYALFSGALLAVPASRDPDAVAECLAQHRVTLLPTSPTFLNLLLAGGAAARHDLSALRIITYGTEQMPAGLLARVRAAFPNARLLQTFGTSETGIVRTDSPDSESTWLRFDDPAIEHRVVDGELWLRSKTQALGYLNAPMDRFTADGWFRTGDQVETAPDGRLRVLGRETELVNVGGEKVWPAEVESVLLESPEVAACLVRGEPNALTGQTVVAQVVPATPQSAAELEALKRRLRQHCRARLAAYKIPTRMTFLDQLAVTARFKVRRNG
jgi:acyl-coenzyme A synthetase/AMP-(fatty) acid ligase